MTCAGCEARDRTIAGLTEELAAWKDYGGDNGAPLERRWLWRKQFGLTNAEAAVLIALVDRDGALLTRAAAMQAHLSSFVTPRTSADEPDQKIIDVYVCRIRKLLRPWFPENIILNSFGLGYFMLAAPARALKSIVGEVEA